MSWVHAHILKLEFLKLELDVQVLYNLRVMLMIERYKRAVAYLYVRIVAEAEVASKLSKVCHLYSILLLS